MGAVERAGAPVLSVIVCPLPPSLIPQKLPKIAAAQGDFIANPLILFGAP
jgi:hypothetical protein